MYKCVVCKKRIWPWDMSGTQESADDSAFTKNYQRADWHMDCPKKK